MIIDLKHLAGSKVLNVYSLSQPNKKLWVTLILDVRKRPLTTIEIIIFQNTLLFLLSSMNFFNFQKLVLNDGFEGTVEEEVKVNQRHLIDKILARYSAEFTTFRELMQNTNDSEGESAELRFITSEESNTVVQIEYRNNGKVFNNADWDRLRKISEGNPDESKIGFFGVGFYSLFSLCEEPFVCSGDEFMGFFWKGDQLFTKTGKLPEPTPKSDNGNRWTSFIMTLRDPMNFPDTTQFATFLSKSLLFTTHLCNVSVYFDSLNVVSVSKVLAPLTTQKTSWQYSTQSFFCSNQIEIQPVQLNVSYLPIKTSIKATLLAAFWGSSSSSSNKIEFGSEIKFSTFYNISAFTLSTSLPSSFNKHYYRMTKKQPPKHPRISLIFTTYEQHLASNNSNSNFSNLLTEGQIYIGFPTYQTTGIKAHIYSQFIPTVEREQIDFIDSNLRQWNLELLSMGALLSRNCYEIQLQLISNDYNSLCNGIYPTLQQSKNDPKYAKFIESFSFLLSQFTFTPSTPNPLVSNALKHSFFKDLNILDFPILSTHGLSTIKSTRIIYANTLPGLFSSDPSTTSLANFINGCPILFPQFIISNPQFMQLLLDHNCTNDFTVNDVINQLQSTTFSIPNDLTIWTHFLKWFQTEYTKDKDYLRIIKSIQININGSTILLSLYTHYALSSEIWSDFKLPLCVIPIFIIATLGINITQWPYVKYDIIQFAKYIYTTELPLDHYPKLLLMFNQQLPTLTSIQQSALYNILNNYKCIPTQHGLYHPFDAYCSAILFTDLPFINIKISPTFESNLKLRTTIPLQLLFDRLHLLQWDFNKLIKYLSTCDLNASDIAKLRELPIFPCSSGNNARIDALYPNLSQFSALELPLLAYKWHPNKSECQFMVKLGINTVVEWSVIHGHLIQEPPNTASPWFRYLMAHYATYKSVIPSGCQFIPATNATDTVVLGHLQNTFNSHECLVLPNALYFNDINGILGLLETPSIPFLLESISNIKYSQAMPILEYLSTVAIPSKYVQEIRIIPFLPLNNKLYAPSDVYLSDTMDDTTTMSTLFQFVSYTPLVNTWLLQLHVSYMPSVSTICNRLPLQDTKHHLKLLLHLSKLEFTAELQNGLSSDFKLLGLRNNNELETCHVSTVVLDDNQHLVTLFNPLYCPLEPLNKLYAYLGVQWISQLVHTTYSVQGSPIDTDECKSLKSVLNTRIPLLLYELNTNLDEHLIHSNCKKSLITVQIAQVDGITRTYKYNNTTINEPTTCYYDLNNNKIFVTRPLDDYEYCQILCRMIYKHGNMHHDLLVHTLMTMDMMALKKRGYRLPSVLDKDLEYAVEEMGVKPRDRQVDMVEESRESTPLLTNDSREQQVQERDQQQMPNMPNIPTSLLENKTIRDSLKYLFNKSKNGKNEEVQQQQQPPRQQPPRVPLPVSNMDNQHTNRLQQELENSIQNTNKNKPREINEQQQVIEQQQPINTVKTYCGVNTNLEYYGTYKEYTLYMSKVNNHIHLTNKQQEINGFSQVLDIMSTIFNIEKQGINIYYDLDTNVIAFNRNRGLYFNVVVYEQMHFGSEAGLRDICSWWYLIFAHELAHNHAQGHDEQHEHYLEGYASMYMGQFMDYFKN